MSLSISKIFDRYDLLARLVPGLLPALVPATSVWIAFPEFQPQGTSQWVGSSLLTIAIVWVLGSWARSRGRATQEKLRAQWGGLPTEILIRHRDPTIETPTKRRYHAALKTIARDVSLPDPESELSDPEAADSAYRSAVRRLIEIRRGTAFKLILADNIAYGFWRNLLGMKMPAIFMAFTAIVIISMPEIANVTGSGINVASVVGIKSRQLIGLMFDVVWLIFLVTAVTNRQVWDAGRAYAERLFSSLELESSPSSSKRPAKKGI